MDIDMPGLSAFEAARVIRDRLPNTRVLFLSAYVRDGFISQALEVRARGYLTKGQNPEELIGCIRKVIGGGSCFSPEVESRLEIGPGGVGLTQKRRSRLELPDGAGEADPLLPGARAVQEGDRPPGRHQRQDHRPSLPTRHGKARSP